MIFRRQSLTRAVLLLLIPTTACYTYVPLPPDPAGPPEQVEGRDVELRLTAPGAVRLAERTGRTERVLRGELMDVVDDEFRLRVSMAGAPQGAGASGSRLATMVSIPRGDIEELSTRELHRGKTVAFIAGSLAGATAIVLAALGIAGELSSEREPENPTPAVSIPLGSLGW